MTSPGPGPPPTGGQGTAAGSGSPAPSPSYQPDDPVRYRLVMMGRPGQRNTDLPKLYDDVDQAVGEAQWIMAQLAAKPHRRPREIVVFDVWTGEIKRRVRPDDPEPFG